MSIALWTTDQANAQLSEEEALATRMVMDQLAALDRRAAIHRVQPGGESPERAIDRALREHLANDPRELNRSDCILILRDTWIALGAECLQRLKATLDARPELDCVVSMEPRTLPANAQPDYQTLYGLERFSQRLGADITATPAPAGGESHLFVVRAPALAEALRDGSLFSVPTRLGDRTTMTPAAYAHPLPAYHGHDRREMLTLIPPDVENLLDIGCGNGAFGALVMQERGCPVVGIEQHASAARLAGDRLSRVVIGDALHAQPGQRFHCVTCLDSLEHLHDPEAMLARIAGELLLPGGWLVASVPNVGHWSIVVDLLAGRWDYVPAGLLCVTHRRFFTERTLTEMLHRYGFEVHELQPTVHETPAHLREHLMRLGDLGFDIDARSLDTTGFHLVARRRRGE